MAVTLNGSTTPLPSLYGESGSPLYTVLMVVSVVGMISNLVLCVFKLILKFAMPDAWKYSCLLLDLSHFTLGVGLVLVLCFIRYGLEDLCTAAGFFLLIGVLDSLCICLISNVIMLFVQYPEKLTGYSHYPKWTLPSMLVPEKTVTFVLSLVSFLPINYFTSNKHPYVIACFPVRETSVDGEGYGAALMFMMWAVLIISVTMCLVTTFRLWKSSGGRIHASSPNIWQLMMLSQGKTFQRFLLLQQLLWMVVLFMTTIIVYTNTSRLFVPQWIGLLGLAATTVFHAILSTIVTVMWSTLCCRTKQQAKEPYQKLKKLELLKIDAPGKLRMKATWSVGKGAVKRGLLKVYGVEHQRAWAQEIVILGMMRKSPSASLLQCLWTNSGNPYFETMTMITGEIVPSESRLICFELTNSGTLDEFLLGLDMPLPEPCQRTIIHDVAEGLSCLHSHNILHHRLTSACVYLKGSVQCMVLRAALGDFECAQIYGSLQGGSSTSSQVSRKQFFLPDIRAFALVALEIIGFVCKKRQEDKQPFRKTRSELIVNPKKGGHKVISKNREGLRNKMYKSRSLDEKTMVKELNDEECFGSLVSVKEMDPHPHVPEEPSTDWAQPVTSVKIIHRTDDAEYFDLHSPEAADGFLNWNDNRGDFEACAGGPVAEISNVQQSFGGVFRAESNSHENEYEEIEEITEQIQRNQRAIRETRYSHCQHTSKDYHGVSTAVKVSVPVDVQVRHVLPETASCPTGMFHRTDPLRHSASSVSTLADIAEEIPQESKPEHVNQALKDLWLQQEAEKKEKLIESYNERMKKELRDVFSKRNKKGKDRKVSKETVHEISRPMSPKEQQREDHEQTPVVPFVKHGGPAKSGKLKRPHTARPSLTQMGVYTKPVPHRPAPPPPGTGRPHTASNSQTVVAVRPASTMTRPVTAGNGVKKAQARTHLLHNLNNKHVQNSGNEKRGQSAAGIEMKYASVKRIPAIHNDSVAASLQRESAIVLTNPAEPASVTKPGHFSSFSSNDSFGSSIYKNRHRKANVSLTSGELSSISSQADTLVPNNDIKEVNEVSESYPPKQVKIDSGFDSGSVGSDVSCEECAAGERVCSCSSGSYTTETYSSYQCSISPTTGMHTKPTHPWSKSDSFSSYDSTDVDQKLERLRSGADLKQTIGVLGPDQQYPMDDVTKPGVSGKVRKREEFNGRHHRVVVSKTQRSRKSDFGSASKRYKELRKKGVPMRVSVVSSASSQEASDATDWDSYMESTAEVIEEEDDNVIDDNADDLFSALDSHQFFEHAEIEPVRDAHSNFQKPVAVVQGIKRTSVARTNSMILDDIIRELPGELTGASTDDETRSFLVKSQDKDEYDKMEEEVVDMPIELPYEPSSIVDAELVIDRLFTKRNTLKHKGSLQDVMDPILGFDETLIRELAAPTGRLTPDQKTTPPLQMLKGVNQTHVESCKELSSRVSLVSFSELFPASNGQFRVLRSRLEKVGNFGTIGKQLLDTVQLCWVSDSPPSASELVTRLLDSVTETEL